MKLLRYGLVGQEKPALLDKNGQIRDLSQHVSDIQGATLLPENLKRLKAIDPMTLPLIDSSSVRLGPCVNSVGKFLCIGLNYFDHAAETGATIPEEPVLFAKATSAICGPNDDIIIPRHSKKTDWEVELGVIIGQPAKYVTEQQALNHVAGYCVIDDMSEREFQLE